MYRENRVVFWSISQLFTNGIVKNEAKQFPGVAPPYLKEWVGKYIFFSYEDALEGAKRLCSLKADYLIQEIGSLQKRISITEGRIRELNKVVSSPDPEAALNQYITKFLAAEYGDASADEDDDD